MDVDEALRRVRLIAPMLRKDVRTAVLSHAAMEASNDLIPKGMTGLHSEFTDTFGIVQNGLALKLALDLARIFDLSVGGRFPPEEQDKASVQVLAALLMRADVRARLEKEASAWFAGVSSIGTIGMAPAGAVEAALKALGEEHRTKDLSDCQAAIGDLLSVVDRLTEDGTEEKVALSRIRQFRNRRLAHSLFDKEPDELPRYSDMNLLLKIAMEVAKHASLAIEGLNTEFEDQAKRARKNADGYAACLLEGLKQKAIPISPAS